MKYNYQEIREYLEWEQRTLGRLLEKAERPGNGKKPQRSLPPLKNYTRV